jgi:hypothetical protein
MLNCINIIIQYYYEITRVSAKALPSHVFPPLFLGDQILFRGKELLKKNKATTNISGKIK